MAKKPNPIRPRKKDEKGYERAVRKQFLDPFNAVLRSRLSQVESAKDALVELSKVEAMAVNPPTDVVRGELSKIDQYHMERTKKTFYSAFGIDVSSYLHGANVRAYLDEVVEENLKLISSLPPRSVEGLRKKISDKIDVLPFDQKAFSELVDSEIDVSQSRLRLITRDQNNKFIGKLTEFRQNELGIQSYQWSTSGDERVRPSHRANNNRIFQWGKPPLTGNPGEDILCRCVAIPDLTNYDRDRLRGNATEQAEIVQEAPELTDVVRAQRLLDDIKGGRVENQDLFTKIDEIESISESPTAKAILLDIQAEKAKRMSEAINRIAKEHAIKKGRIEAEYGDLLRKKNSRDLNDAEKARLAELKIENIKVDADSNVIKGFINEFKGAQRIDRVDAKSFEELETERLYRAVAGKKFVEDNLDNGWLGQGVYGDGSYSAYGGDRPIVWMYGEYGKGYIYAMKAKPDAKLIDYDELEERMTANSRANKSSKYYDKGLSDILIENKAYLNYSEKESFVATYSGYDGIVNAGGQDYMVLLNKRAFVVDQASLPGGNRNFIQWLRENDKDVGLGPDGLAFDEYEAWAKTNL